MHTADNALSRCLSIDLEVSRQDHRIYALAGTRADTGQSVLWADKSRSNGQADRRVTHLEEDDVVGVKEGVAVEEALAALNELAAGADFVVGHNIIEFDLPHLQANAPGLGLLAMPVVDTLWLNPLAFPGHPYHHLVKHYKDAPLKRSLRNDPYLDARLALQVFKDQQHKLTEAPAEMVTAWHWLSTSPAAAGFDLFFTALRGSQRPEVAEAREAIRAGMEGRCCQSEMNRAVADATEHGWALAYALAWLSVSGANSVMPPWVRHQFPAAGRLVRRLRDEACSEQGCGWCRRYHNPVSELKRLFGFEAFRPEPKEPDTGKPMQQVIVEAAMKSQDVLAILPTGTGKSLCYQIPALSRYYKTGALTVVLSPLVALMADQAAGLKNHGITSCVTVNGLLSMPERAEALEQVRLGDAAILLISPEQLRSVSVRSALQQREIGAWVLDEAHCLSKWGHDFRPDYRYVGRFISERAGSERTPPVLCLTATAKPEVKTEICDYFKRHLGIDMKVFDGGSRRSNLDFVVIPTSEPAKHQHIYSTLAHHLPPETPGGAIVYCATRRRTEQIAEFLQEKGFDADRFHAGLPPEEKKTIQQRFIAGELRAIAATNAFGMGIDKRDVRLVIHADIPSSLENYLQEAGRAGRDQQLAHCVLLYTNDDVERQFGMSARSRLTRREIHGILRALRALDRRGSRRGEVVASPGEILIEDEADDFRRDTVTDDTRVRTAVAWLEEAKLLTREENRVKVFPSALRVASVQDAKNRLAGHRLDAHYRDALVAVVETLIAADPDEGISTDMLMEVSGLPPDRITEALNDLERLGLASNDTVITAFVHHGVRRPSHSRLTEAAAIEQRLIEMMRELAPDMAEGEQAPLNLRVAAQGLKDSGFPDARPEHVTRTLEGLARDGRGAGGAGGSVAMRKHAAETVMVTLKRSWDSLAGMAQRRRAAAAALLDHLLNELPAGSRGNDQLVTTTLGKLQQSISETLEADPQLQSDTKDPRKLMERALLWMHEQEVIRLNRGLTVFRPAMTIALEPETRGFRQSDFEELQHHYDRSVQQIHVMAEYAELGRDRLADALRLALDYFALGDDEFVRRWLPHRRSEMSRETTPESWQAIVESLNNPRQRALVADDREATNVLVLAGPGSGKTTVLVHRIAYLVRVRRQDPRGILALAYNRHAAAEIRRRLRELIGNDSRGVMVFTCHALAMRLVGASFSATANQPRTQDIEAALKATMKKATALLRGEELEPEEAEESRSRLLAGFRWILVDEYQDIGPEEYELIAALAGRTVSDADTRLTIFAVGDDDQNIYAFNGSSPEFIRRFEKDYNARTSLLVENYRSSGHVIDAANAVIAPAKPRMKTDHAIRRNDQRSNDPPGGIWQSLDPVSGGRAQILAPAGDAMSQAQAAMAEMTRLSSLAADWDWGRCAVIAREWSYLEPVRSICERDNIPAQLANEGDLSIWHLRETQSLKHEAQRHGTTLLRHGELKAWIDRQQSGPWIDLLAQALEEHELETGGAEVPAASFIEWLAEWCRDTRRRQRGLLLLTAHRAKGLEFDHVVVLDGGWDRRSRREDADAPRRLYYVAMTRAKQTLTLTRLQTTHPFHSPLNDRPSALWRPHAALPSPTLEMARRYRTLALKDVDLGFAGRKPPNNRVHRSIRILAPGDRLQIRRRRDRWELLDSAGLPVGALARSFDAPDNLPCTQATVAAVATWNKDRSDPQFRQTLQCDHWEVVIPELIFEPGQQPRPTTSTTQQPEPRHTPPR